MKQNRNWGSIGHEENLVKVGVKVPDLRNLVREGALENISDFSSMRKLWASLEVAGWKKGGPRYAWGSVSLVLAMRLVPVAPH